MECNKCFVCILRGLPVPGPVPSGLTAFCRGVGCWCNGWSGDRIWIMLVDCSDLACCYCLFVCLLLFSGLGICYCCIHMSCDEACNKDAEIGCMSCGVVCSCGGGFLVCGDIIMIYC